MTEYTLFVTIPAHLKGTDVGSPAWLSCSSSNSDLELEQGNQFNHRWTINQQKFESLVMVVDVDLESQQLDNGDIAMKTSYILEIAEREKLPQIVQAYKNFKPDWFE